MDKYKRNYNFKSDEGDKNGLKWLIVLLAIVIIAISYFF